MPAANTKLPTPRSMSDVPKLSVFAKRRGNTGKSTARILIHVEIIIEARYVVMNGLTGRRSRSLSEGASAGLPFGSGFAISLDLTGDCNKVATDGKTRRPIKT